MIGMMDFFCSGLIFRPCEMVICGQKMHNGGVGWGLLTRRICETEGEGGVSFKNKSWRSRRRWRKEKRLKNCTLAQGDSKIRKKFYLKKPSTTVSAERQKECLKSVGYYDKNVLHVHPVGGKAGTIGPVLMTLQPFFSLSLLRADGASELDAVRFKTATNRCCWAAKKCVCVCALFFLSVEMILFSFLHPSLVPNVILLRGFGQNGSGKEIIEGGGRR